MKLSSRLVAAAAAGVLAGVSGCGKKGDAPMPAGSAGQAPSSTMQATPAKHACKGQNECKGQGGCKTDKHACKGQNDCKGQGGCSM